jgi:hypothetical protein
MIRLASRNSAVDPFPKLQTERLSHNTTPKTHVVQSAHQALSPSETGNRAVGMARRFVEAKLVAPLWKEGDANGFLQGCSPEGPIGA